MGNSESRSRVENIIENVSFNQEDINTINKSISKDISSNIEETNNKCGSEVLISQMFDMSNCKIGGDLNYGGVKQTIKLDIKSDCSNETQKQSAVDKVMQTHSKAFIELANSATNDTVSKAASEATSNTGLGIGSSDADSSVLNTVLNSTTNITKVNTENIMEQEMNVSNIYEAVNECFSDFKIKNQQDLSGCDVGGNANISDIEQNTTGSITANCMASSKTFSQATQKFLTSMGASMKSEKKISNKSTLDSTSKSSATTGFTASGSASIMGCCVLCVAVIGILSLLKSMNDE